MARTDWMDAVRKDPKSFCTYDSYSGYAVSRTKIVSQLGCSLVTSDKLKMILTPLVESLNRLEGPERIRLYHESLEARQLERESKIAKEQSAVEAKKKEAEEAQKQQHLRWIEEYRLKYPGMKLPLMLQEWAKEYGLSENDISPRDPVKESS